MNKTKVMVIIDELNSLFNTTLEKEELVFEIKNYDTDDKPTAKLNREKTCPMSIKETIRNERKKRK